MMESRGFSVNEMVEILKLGRRFGNVVLKMVGALCFAICIANRILSRANT
jgi:hypothetical protein